MIIDWLKFPAALLLLLTPITLFHGRKVRYRPISRDWERHWPQILALGLHWIDFLRATLGTWLLVESLRASGATGAIRYAPLLTQAAVLALAVTLQAFVCKEPDSAHAPFAFVTGAAAGFLPAPVAGFAVLLAVTITAGARKPGGYFVLLAGSVGAIGFLLHGRSLVVPLAIVIVAVLLPWLLTLLFPRHLVVSYLARRPSEGHPPELSPKR